MKNIFAFVLILWVPLILSATIRHVPTLDYPTIQAGIDSAIVGDTILVETGTYVENINFNGKDITVASQFLFDPDTVHMVTTIIDGDQNGSVVRFENGEDSTSLFCGFTIQNGSAEVGGGIFCDGVNPIFKNLVIKNNSGTSDGGGITLLGSSVSLENVVVKNNTAEVGAGIYCAESDLVLKNVDINNNTSLREGGGIQAHYSNISIDSCSFTYNEAQEENGGAFC